MTVGRDYMLRKGGGPSAPKLFLDTKVVPRLVDVAGGAEVALDRAARATGVRPSLLLAGTMSGLAVAVVGIWRSFGAKRRASGERAVGAGAPGEPT
ncbi:hypothetical protein GCM10011380_06400 [Sphingomonas metalli]|uniref:Uncharacterized protein n=1 Tax=Sphingomonas metalli TaxID=1779358 RepID=A0A916WNJ8_9SPHN|nr:hypothetical protein [Sphingomonas metalli]GGB19552.1 hypothetical protein GCM10011380_06400 [Sphingomonas metalli]